MPDSGFQLWLSFSLSELSSFPGPHSSRQLLAGKLAGPLIPAAQVVAAATATAATTSRPQFTLLSLFVLMMISDACYPTKLNTALGLQNMSIGDSELHKKLVDSDSEAAKIS